MASSSSWFPRSSPSGQDYELPRWHSPAHMTASLIPPPIVQSAYTSSPTRSPVLPVRSVILEKPAATVSHESELQADLQFLLDAQAEGLIRGLEGGAATDDISSQGSATPTARSLRAQSYQANRPLKRRLGLRSARKGIYSCMVKLSGIKQEELASAQNTLAENESVLERISNWEEKRAGLEDAVSKVNSEEETIRVQRLQREADVMQEEISRVEMHLMELKTKRRSVLKQAAAIENSVQAKLASYTTSLNMLEKEVTSFLTRRPAQDIAATTILAGGKQSLWQLPSDRRTLELAKEQFQAEQEELRARKEDVRTERDALNTGATVWKDVVERVTAFEKHLRSEMAQLGSTMTDSVGAWDDTPQTTPAERMADVREHLEGLITHLKQQIRDAELRNWRLLIAAVGAELDALQRGKQILDGIVGRRDRQDGANSDDGSRADVEHDAANGHPSHPAHIRARSKGRSDTDEEPDPDLLFSIQDDETDG